MIIIYYFNKNDYYKQNKQYNVNQNFGKILIYFNYKNVLKMA